MLVQYISPRRQLELDNLATFLVPVVYNLGTNQHVVLINSEMERLGGWARQKGVSLKISSELQVSGPRFDSLLNRFYDGQFRGKPTCRPRSLCVFGVNGL